MDDKLISKIVERADALTTFLYDSTLSARLEGVLAYLDKNKTAIPDFFITQCYYNWKFAGKTTWSVENKNGSDYELHADYVVNNDKCTFVDLIKRQINGQFSYELRLQHGWLDATIVQDTNGKIQTKVMSQDDNHGNLEEVIQLFDKSLEICILAKKAEDKTITEPELDNLINLIGTKNKVLEDLALSLDEKYSNFIMNRINQLQVVQVNDMDNSAITSQNHPKMK